MPKTRELSVFERMQVYDMRKNGKTLRQIAEIYHISPEGVNKIIKRITTSGSPENTARTGRNRKTTTYEDRKILKEVRANPFISASDIKEKLNLSIQTTQIKSRIHEAEIHARVARKRPFISKVNAQKRLAFARAHLNKGPEFWDSIIWSDESKFELKSNNRRRYVWRKKGDQFKKCNIIPTVKHGTGNIMVWGCCNSNGVGKLVQIDGIMTGATYVNILEDNLFESAVMLGLDRSFIFQQDNDPKHKSKVARLFFENNNVNILEWPPQSPDLNPIEHLWDHLDRNICQRARYSKATFLGALKREWSKIDDQTVKRLIKSVPNRLQEVIKANGYQTSY